jgi:hypothetical protein
MSVADAVNCVDRVGRLTRDCRAGLNGLLRDIS